MSPQRFQFDDFVLDVGAYELRQAQRSVALERLPMELLILLLENCGKLVTRDTIVQRLWGQDVFVETEHGINTAMNKLRAALHDSRIRPRYVQTVVGKGYRFIAEVRTTRTGELENPVSLPQPRLIPWPQVPAPLVAPVVRQGGAVAVPKSQLEPAQSESPSVDSNLILHYVPTAAELPTPVSGDRRWLMAALLSAVVAVTVLARFALRQTDQRASIQSIAVLPLLNLSQDPEQDYLVDGLTDELITNLARSTSLRVISRTSVMQYKNTKKSLPEIAKALNVDSIVEGSVMRTGDQVRITAQLLDALNDRHLWAQSYQQRQKDVLSMQDEVTNDIAREITSRIVGKTPFIRSRPVTPPGA